MRLVIDIREADLYTKIVEILAKLPDDAKKRIEFVQESLPIGDILIQTDDLKTLLVIERKTFLDLIASVKDGRYEEQSHRLLNTTGVAPHSIIYLLEGSFGMIPPQNKKLIYSCMASLNYFKGFSVMRTATVYETGEWLIATTEKIDRELLKGRVPISMQLTNTLSNGETQMQPDNEQQNAINYCNFVKKVKKENVTPENIGEIVLTQIPGISSVTAITIMKKFSTFPKLLLALKENPDCMKDMTIETNGKVRKINKSCIENIKLFFNE
jgi:ERCC4-type nuclease